MNDFQARLIHAIRYEFSDEAVLALLKPKLGIVQEMMQAEAKVEAKAKAKAKSKAKSKSVPKPATPKASSSYQVLTTAAGTELVARRLPNRSWKIVDATSVQKHKKAQIVAMSTNLKAALKLAKAQERLLKG